MRDATAGTTRDHGSALTARAGDAHASVAELVEGRRRAERLQAFTAALAVADSADAVHDAVVEHGRTAIGATAAAVVVPAGDDAAILEIARSVGFGVPALAQWMRFPAAAAAPVADAIRTGEPVWVPTPEAMATRYPSVIPLLEATGYRSWLAIPFVIGDGEGRRALGAVGVAYADAQGPSETERDFLVALGRQAAQALDRVWLLATLRESEARHAMVSEVVNDGLWDWHVPSGVVRYSHRWAGMLGYAPGEVEPHLRTWERLVHPDDLPMVRRALEEHFDGRSAVYETEHRMRHRDGRWVWIRDRGKVLARDAAGRPVRMMGTHTDISELRARREEAAEAQALARALLVNFPGGAAFVVDRELRYLLAEGEALRAAGLARETVVGRTVRDALGPDESARIVPQYERVLAGEPFEHEHESHGRVFMSRGVPLRDEAGRVVAALAVSYDITERRRAEAEREQALAAAEAARREAEQANAAKSAFLASMSHELRTPLNAIAGHAQLMELGIHGPVTEAQQEALGRVQRAQQHLLGLITDILDFAKIEAGRVEFALRPLDVREVLQATAPLVEPQCHAKGITCALELPDHPCTARADRDKLAQVLLNLFSNAVKFTPTGGRILARVEADGSAPVRVVVADTGIGIAPEQLDSIFEPFVQVGRLPHDRTEGTGLGLTISRDLARGMGGELTAASVPGEGSTFTLVLPAG